MAILGHSWGSVLGPIFAARFPEKVSVYVGAAWIGDWPAAESWSYSFALAEAERRHDQRALKKLRAIGPPPYPAKSVFIQRAALKIVFQNLLLNASHAMKGRGTIRIGVDEVDHLVRLTVADTGPGVPPEARAKLFEPFFTAKARGTGWVSRLRSA